jgi:predicted amidohydrolase YtcJ
MRGVVAGLAGIVSFVLIGYAAPPDGGPADAIFVNGKLWTVDPAKPEAQALAIWHDRIIAIGSDAEVRAIAGPTTRVIDLRGRRVVPGFYDSHVHLLMSGMQLGQVELKDCPDEADFGKRLSAFDRKMPRDRWLLGGNWDHDRAFAGKLPTAELLDKYVSDRPVFIVRYDGHMGVANTRALKLAGITAATPNPKGGEIVRKPNSNEPAGVLRDNAMDLLDKVIPPPSEAEIVEGVRAALAECRKYGVTSVQDMDGSDANTRKMLLRLLQQMARNGQLTLRVDFRWPLAAWKELATLGVEGNFGNDYVRVGGIKGFVDGSIGSSTAKMFEPFLNEPDSTGKWVTTREQLRSAIVGADKAGISVAIHAIGDEANALLLDIFAEAERVNGPRDRRFRIEHAQHLRPQDIPRFKELGVIASMQPYHAIDDGRWVEGRIGKKRCATSYALKSLEQSGARLAFGSDWPVAPIDAIGGIDAAVNRRTLDGKNPNGWCPEQKITVQQAIEGYTMGSAYAGFQERDRGSLTPGKLADFAVLSRDILAPAERDHIAETTVLATVVGGKVVYEKRD